MSDLTERKDFLGLEHIVSTYSFECSFCEEVSTGDWLEIEKAIDVALTMGFKVIEKLIYCENCLSEEDKEKLIVWQSEYRDSVNWEMFRDNYYCCSNCGCWDNTPCICYAR